MNITANIGATPRLGIVRLALRRVVIAFVEKGLRLVVKCVAVFLEMHEMCGASDLHIAFHAEASHISCDTVRSYVGQVGLVQAKALARAAGMTASQEQRARRCLAKKGLIMELTGMTDRSSYQCYW
jgi:hypothetical protein